MLGTDSKIFVPAPVYGAWQTPTFSNGNSFAGSPVQFRLEPGNVCRIAGIFQFPGSDGTSQILGLPIPISQSCYFMMGGNGGASYPNVAWHCALNNVGTMSFFIIAPSGAKQGGVCGLSGITYVHTGQLGSTRSRGTTKR